MPSDPSLADLQTGLILATAITKRGGQPMIVGPDDQRAQIRAEELDQPLVLGGLLERKRTSTSYQPPAR
jgi:hypothetical protein